MIIQRCDICKKEVDKLNSVILYKTYFDYCDNCIDKAQRLITEFEKERKFQNILYDSILRKRENEYIKKMKK